METTTMVSYNDYKVSIVGYIGTKENKVETTNFIGII